MKLGLGTVRFGQKYGISGTGSLLSPERVAETLRLAAERGIAYLDTAPSYGRSEAVLGDVLWEAHPFKIVSKTPVFRRPITRRDGRAVADSFQRSLERLRQPGLYGLLVHDAEDLLAEGGEHIFEALTELKDGGGIVRIGASVYDAGQIDRLLGRFRLDLIQVPLNLLDQRLLVSGHLRKMKSVQIEIHARSVFLQGLLLMEPERLPPHFGPIRAHLREYHRDLRERGMGPVAAALAFVKGVRELDAVICGVESPDQLRQVHESFVSRTPVEDWSRFRLDDPRFVNPARWVVDD